MNINVSRMCGLYVFYPKCKCYQLKMKLFLQQKKEENGEEEEEALRCKIRHLVWKAIEIKENPFYRWTFCMLHRRRMCYSYS